jgi:hypothetical protein
MKTKIMVISLFTLFMASIHLIEAQEPKKIPKVGYLSGGSASTAGG